MSFGSQEEQPLDEDDLYLGTVIKLLYTRGEHKAVSTLLAAESVKLVYDHDDWGVYYYNIRLAVQIDQFDELRDEDVFTQISRAYDAVWETRGRESNGVDLVPALVRGNWRQDVNAFLRGTASNQAAIAPLPDNAPPRVDNLAFRDRAELMLYRALKAKQESLPKAETLSIAPNPAVRIPGRTWEPDFIVLYKGRVGIIEVDGSSHLKKYASDRSRDILLEDAGAAIVMRIDVADAESSEEAAAHVEKFLIRLMRRS